MLAFDTQSTPTNGRLPIARPPSPEATAKRGSSLRHSLAWRNLAGSNQVCGVGGRVSRW